MSDHKCGGCETMPTRGFDSKPANEDGLIHWCDVSRKAAREQELLRDPSWRLPTQTPKERAAMARYLGDRAVAQKVQDSVCCHCRVTLAGFGDDAAFCERCWNRIEPLWRRDRDLTPAEEAEADLAYENYLSGGKRKVLN